jgi:hypothetical protein
VKRYERALVSAPIGPPHHIPDRGLFVFGEPVDGLIDRLTPNRPFEAQTLGLFSAPP